MKATRLIALSLFAYTLALAPGLSQAHGVEIILPGVSVRLPGPPVLMPRVVEREVVYERVDPYMDYRRMPPRYVREDWRRERCEERRYGAYEHGRHGWGRPY
ncbi:hypothetical protein [Uliginosibacterium sediminicola]|uniref:Uncharacterized protein n=1 Tax=Uliginosibacterium sediminicola TaxID=2024550 RepID=A0ABU9YX94_9RHOO